MKTLTPRQPLSRALRADWVRFGPMRLNPHSTSGRIVERVLRICRNVRARAGRRLGWIAPINDYEARATSQNGEDGIIAEIFRRIGTTNRFFVEFGVEDGAQCNTAQLALAGWSGLMIEADPHFHAQLVDRWTSFPMVRVARFFITAENVASIFADNGVPREFDMLSIDIDGNDYWVWRALSQYRPRLVIIEYNVAYAPPKRWVMQYNPTHRWDQTTYYGASLTSLTALAEGLGYALIGTDAAGVNAFFLRVDLIKKARFPNLPAVRGYHPAWFEGSDGIGHRHRDGAHVEI
jgi:hypothetical protein